jgi:polyisoprenoid-binding protein YceI
VAAITRQSFKDTGKQMKTALFSTLLFLASSTGAATEFKFDAGNSELGFTGDYGGEAVPGVFKRFSGTASFDLSQPLATRFATEIEVASLDTDYADRDDTLRGPEFFDSEQFPVARWTSDGDCSVTGTQLSCPGRLTLKGQTHPVPIQITPSADGQIIEGKASFARSQFAIGSGEWTDTETIADRVEVQFKLQVR